MRTEKEIREALDGCRKIQRHVKVDQGFSAKVEFRVKVELLEWVLSNSKEKDNGK